MEVLTDFKPNVFSLNSGSRFIIAVGKITREEINAIGVSLFVLLFLFHTTGKSYIDLTNPDAIKEFETRLDTNQYKYGVKGHKMDRADESFPLTTKWFDPISESDSRNKYVYLFSKVIDDFLNKVHGKDNFNFARAAFHRVQPYLSAVWGGDSRNNWHGMAGNQANAIRCGFMGFPVWGGDTGGYLGRGKIDEDLYIRWLQLSAWNGMFEVKIDGAGGWGEDRPPWKYSEKLQDIYKTVSDTRMELLPYIYSCVNTSYKNCVMMKPLTYMYPDDENTYDIWDEYILGNAFLVAPVLTSDKNHEIYLPKGKWYDYNSSGKEYEGPITYKQNTPLETIPVFIKENTIYLTGNIYQGNSRLWEDKITGNEEITIHLFPGEERSETSFDYVDYLDNDKEKKMILSKNKDTAIFLSDALSTNTSFKIKCSIKPKEVIYNGSKIDFEYDGISKLVKLSTNKGKAINLKVVY